MNNEFIFLVSAIIVLGIFAIGFGIALLIYIPRYAEAEEQVKEYKSINEELHRRMNEPRRLIVESHMEKPTEIFAEIAVPRELKNEVPFSLIQEKLKQEIFDHIDIAAFDIQEDVSMPSFDSIYRARLQIINKGGVYGK